MKQFDLAPRAWTNNWEMAFAFALPAGVGLFVSVHAYYGSLLLASIMGAVSTLVTGWLVLFLMRPIPGLVSVGPTELKISGAGFRANVPLEDVDLAEVKRCNPDLFKQASLLFVTTPAKAVWIPLRSGGGWLISPKDPERLIGALHGAAALAADPA